MIAADSGTVLQSWIGISNVAGWTGSPGQPIIVLIRDSAAQHEFIGFGDGSGVEPENRLVASDTDLGLLLARSGPFDRLFCGTLRGDLRSRWLLSIPAGIMHTQ